MPMSYLVCLDPTCRAFQFQFDSDISNCPSCGKPLAFAGPPPKDDPKPVRKSIKLVHSSGQSFLVSDDEVEIVRTLNEVPTNTINLISFPKSDQVSRHHAIIRWKQNDASYTIKDLGSSNFTFVNGRRLNKDEEVPLNHRDKIRLGDTSYFEFTIEVL
jgi:FHA domain